MGRTGSDIRRAQTEIKVPPKTRHKSDAAICRSFLIAVQPLPHLTRCISCSSLGATCAKGLYRLKARALPQTGHAA